MKVIEPGKLYALENFTGSEVQLIRFTSKVASGEFINGTTVEEIVNLLIDKLYEFQKRSPSPQNEEAITHLRAVLGCMRVRLRTKQNAGTPNSGQ